MENKFKKVDFSSLSVADLVKHLPRGYKLWSPAFDEVELDEVNWGFIHLACGWSFNKHGRLVGAPGNATCCIWPSKEVQSWDNFYAPAKDEVVSYKMDESRAVIHIAGKWFETCSESDSREWTVKAEPVYLAGEFHAIVTGKQP